MNRKFSEKNYSLIGKISIQKFPIILQKDKIMKGDIKKCKIKDLFYPDQPKEEIKYIEDYNTFTNFKLSLPDKNAKGNYKLKYKVDYSFKDMKENTKFFYHNKHLELVDKLKKILITTDNFTYAPKYDLVKPRLLTGPNWEYMSEKKKEKIVYDKRDYYITHEDALNNPNIRCLVNMKKTTQREEFVKQKDIKFKNDRKFVSRFKTKKYKNKNKNKFNIPFTSRNGISKNKIYKLYELYSKTANTIINDKNQKNCSKDHQSSSNEKHVKTKKDKILKKANHSINFKKLISREDAEKVKQPKFFKIPFITPNYSLVEDRLITTISYTKPKYKSYYNPNLKEIEGYDYKLKYSPDKYITKFNNHINPKSPNFSLMLHRKGIWSRNTNKNPLPFYMRDIYDRNSCQTMTEKSLEQNKFKEGKISSASSTFFPKKSFNRVININLMKSKTFKEKLDDDYIEEQKEFLKEDIERKNKNDEIKNLKNSGILDRFENFTLKAIDKREIKHHDSMKNIFTIAY